MRFSGSQFRNWSLTKTCNQKWKAQRSANFVIEFMNTTYTVLTLSIEYMSRNHYIDAYKDHYLLQRVQVINSSLSVDQKCLLVHLNIWRTPGKMQCYFKRLAAQPITKFHWCVFLHTREFTKQILLCRLWNREALTFPTTCHPLRSPPSPHVCP